MDRRLSSGQASCSGRREGLVPRNQCSRQCGGRRSVRVAAIFDPPPFQPEKLTVSFAKLSEDGCSSSLQAQPEAQLCLPRRYTLTHNDITGALTLTVGQEFNHKQISGFYTRLLRDEVVAEWTAEPALHVYCHVSGEERWLAPPGLRNYIFRRELPLVLESFMWADKELLLQQPLLAQAQVWVHFQSSVQELNTVELWGTLAQRCTWQPVPTSILKRLLLLVTGQPIPEFAATEATAGQPSASDDAVLAAPAPAGWEHAQAETVVRGASQHGTHGSHASPSSTSTSAHVSTATAVAAQSLSLYPTQPDSSPSQQHQQNAAAQDILTGWDARLLSPPSDQTAQDRAAHQHANWLAVDHEGQPCTHDPAGHASQTDTCACPRPTLDQPQVTYSSSPMQGLPGPAVAGNPPWQGNGHVRSRVAYTSDAQSNTGSQHASRDMSTQDTRQRVQSSSTSGDACRPASDMLSANRGSPNNMLGQAHPSPALIPSGQCAQPASDAGSSSTGRASNSRHAELPPSNSRAAAAGQLPPGSPAAWSSRPAIRTARPARPAGLDLGPADSREPRGRPAGAAAQAECDVQQQELMELAARVGMQGLPCPVRVSERVPVVSAARQPHRAS